MTDKIKTTQELIEEEYGTAVAINPPPEDEKEEKDTSYVSYFETEDYIYEEVMNATRATRATLFRWGDYGFVKYDKATGEIEEVSDFYWGDKKYAPIRNKLTDKQAIYLPSGTEEYGTTYDLVKEIKDYLFMYFEPPKFYENLLPYYILFTWVYDRFPFIAYLHFIGLTGTGKTVAGETVASLCYKAIDAAGSATISSVFRLSDQWRGTIFLDEFEMSSFGAENYASILAFLKTGVSDRVLLRVEGEKKRDVSTFFVKSPKIFTSEDPITDAGLQSRTFVIRMEKNKRRLPLYKLPNFRDKGDVLRKKLLLWRLRNLNKIDLEPIEYGFSELEGLDRRTQQIVTPIYLLSDDKSREDILEFAKKQEEETYRERREALEGSVFQAIAGVYPLPITLTDIATVVNKDKAGRDITERKIGNIVRKVLGLEIDRIGHDNISTVITKEEKYDELCKYYGIEPLHRNSVASVASVAEEEDEFAEQIALDS